MAYDEKLQVLEKAQSHISHAATEREPSTMTSFTKQRYVIIVIALVIWLGKNVGGVEWFIEAFSE